jgi:transcriptional regulator with XRE-family HTH domain
MSSIIRERIRQQCTLKQMAERTGWSYAAVWNYENNLKRVPLAYAENAAATLGLKLQVARHD